MSIHHYCEYNCGGTGCDAPVRYVTFTSSEKECNHEFSFRVRVKFWIFNKIVEVCPDCEKVIN